jgi:hypothetical protein
MSPEAHRIIRAWRAAEMFVPRPLPVPDARENVIDVSPGNPLPWEPGGRLHGRPAGTAKTWRHQVFGGLFALSRVDAARSGQSALFYCTVGESGSLITGPVVSECAWAVGQTALGDEAVGYGDPAAWLTPWSREGRLRVSPENLPAFPDGPPAAAELTHFAEELAGLLGVTALLAPDGLRVRSYQLPIGFVTDDGVEIEDFADPPLSGYFAADLAAAADGLRDSRVGPALAAFLSGSAGESRAGPAPEFGSAPEQAGEIDRVDVRREPLVVRDGCAPERTPPARWPTAGPLVLSEQFAVNEILAEHAGAVSTVHAPPGSDVTAVFSDLIAAIVTERARALAALASPEAGFGSALPRGSPTVIPPAAALTGFEILLVSPRADARELAAIGDKWLDQAADADYFIATARLAGGTGTWAMLRAHLDGGETARAFAERFWHGALRGADALFPAGVAMRQALHDSPAAGWPAAVARFRSALAEVRNLSASRSQISAAITRLSALEQECEDAYSALDAAQARVAELTQREPVARDELVAAEERRRAAREDLQAHQADKPGMVVAVSTGMRAGRDWYSAHRRLRAVFDDAALERDRALASAQALRAELATARKAITRSRDAASRLAAEMDRLHAPVAAARARWGGHVPEGPSYAETEDSALISLRESSAPWADPEFAAARAELFFAALALHKSFICANADTFETNLSAWAEIVAGTQRPPPAAVLAAWQSFFLVVPVVSTTFTSVGSLLAGLGHASLGWLLADGADGVPSRRVAGALWRTRHAVFGGSPTAAHGLDAVDGLSWIGGAAGASAWDFASRSARFGTSLPDGSWAGLPLYPRDPAAADSGAPATSDNSATSDALNSARGAPSVSQGDVLRSVLSGLRERARARRPPRSA